MYKMKLTKAGCPTEDWEQAKLVTWLSKNDIPHFAIPNGGWRSMLEAVRMKRTGTKAGIPDVCIPLAKEPYHGLYIELKPLKGGRVSDNQKYWLDLLNRNGYFATIAHGADEAIGIVLNYMGHGTLSSA
jgi:hypothetical protein